MNTRQQTAPQKRGKPGRKSSVSSRQEQFLGCHRGHRELSVAGGPGWHAGDLGRRGGGALTRGPSVGGKVTVLF